MTEEHRHQVITHHRPYLCECGATYDDVKERWREPKEPKR